jgi:hypothetical protein
MRFFTMDWWLGLQDVQDGLATDPSEGYTEHLTRLRPLPLEVAALEQLPLLHDAHVRRIEQSAGRLQMDLDVLGPDGLGTPVQLRYAGVEGVTLTSDPDRGLPGPHGLGDLGYDEIDAAGIGLYEHRMLFSTGVELAVRFRGFSFDAAGPGASPSSGSRRRA